MYLNLFTVVRTPSAFDENWFDRVFIHPLNIHNRTVTVTDRYDRYYPHQSVISLKYDVVNYNTVLRKRKTYT